VHPTDVLLLVVGAPALLILAGYEVYAIKDRTPGNTYSERLRVWFRTETKRGAFTFLGLLGAGAGTLIVWLGAHVVQIGV
jgi:hypothetical protein